MISKILFRRQAGQARLINCLDNKKDVITDRCKTAFEEIVVK
jgi:hypothetical protein